MTKRLVFVEIPDDRRDYPPSESCDLSHLFVARRTQRSADAAMLRIVDGFESLLEFIKRGAGLRWPLLANVWCTQSNERRDVSVFQTATERRIACRQGFGGEHAFLERVAEHGLPDEQHVTDVSSMNQRMCGRDAVICRKAGEGS
jgi:hypothetical protein